MAKAPKYTVFHNISEVLTLIGAAGKGGRKVTNSDLSIIKKAAIVVEGQKIAWVGEQKSVPKALQKASKKVDLKGQVVLPAFLDCHTHLVFGGSRASEFELRNQGATYQQIYEAGGGIQSTVRSTRNSSARDLSKISQARANEFASQGVSTIEIKSGYGLSLKEEVKILKVAGELKGPRILRTYLGPHAKSPDFESLKEYEADILEKQLPFIAKNKLADRVDIFVEAGYYSLDFARRYLSQAKKLGLQITIHAEQMTRTGATQLGLELGAKSVDHVIEVSDSDIADLAKSETTAVLLPASDFYLKMKYPPARKLIEAGARVALSTDFNPGTSPTMDIQFVGVLARREMQMKLHEVIAALTIGSAFALGKESELGSLEPGKFADFITIEGSMEELFYSVGARPVTSTWSAGKKIFERRF
jgi:imidazolonepropionase